MELNKGTNSDIQWPWPTMNCKDTFGGAAEFLLTIWHYVEAEDLWLMYSPTAPDYVNDLLEVVEGQLYTFYMQKDCLMEYVAGQIVFTEVAKAFPWKWVLIPAGAAVGALVLYSVTKKKA